MYRFILRTIVLYNLIYSCCRRSVQCDRKGLLVRLLTGLGCCWELTVIGPLWAVAVGPFWAVQSLCFKLLLLMAPTASMISETASVVSPIGYWLTHTRTLLGLWDSYIHSYSMAGKRASILCFDDNKTVQQDGLHPHSSPHEDLLVPSLPLHPNAGLDVRPYEWQ